MPLMPRLLCFVAAALVLVSGRADAGPAHHVPAAAFRN